MSNADGYSSISAFQFTVAAGVLIWLYTLALLALLLVSASGQPPSASFETHVKYGNRLALFFAYSGKGDLGVCALDYWLGKCTSTVSMKRRALPRSSF